MKKQRYTGSIPGFIAGLLLGVTFFTILSFTSAPDQGQTISAITVETAKGLISGYLAGATPSNSVIKGFVIDKSQLDAMNALYRQNTTLSGFRIYLGKDQNNLVRGIVVGLDEQGKDVLTSPIYNTESKLVSPCPPACETSGTLSGN